MKIINKIYNIKSNINKKIVLISDIHYENKKDLKRLNSILDNIREINPDYICIPGDITNTSQIQDEEELVNWLKNLSSITKVIISIGNHEFYINKYKKTYGLNKKLLTKISNIKNIYLLDNDNTIIDDINFIGVTIPAEYYDKEEYFYTWIKNIKTNKKHYNVLLCHSPHNIYNFNELENKNINLVLCGHMHGGVVFNFLRPIFKNRGLISPTKKLFPQNAYGHIKTLKLDILITSGIRVLPFKLLNKLFKPEIVKINLTKNIKKKIKYKKISGR